ncbi:MAG: radical SAM protein, partial [Candidatus Fermentibacteria bacterium]
NKLYRIPWTTTDNAMSWFEPTRKCNITCDECYATNEPDSGKPFDQIASELRSLVQMRKCDLMMIAGGEPLTHDRITDVVSLVKSLGPKPLLVTNAVALDAGLLHELKKAGLFGFIFHIDSHQHRPGWSGKSEVELNSLRQDLVDMVHEEGGMISAFNSTIFPDTVGSVPDIVTWAQRNIDRVHAYTLIAVRMMSPEGPFEFHAGPEIVKPGTGTPSPFRPIRRISSAELLAQVRKAIPDFRLAGYIGGTSLPESAKWSVGVRLGTPFRSFGNIGPKSFELLQTVHHIFAGKYLSMPPPKVSRKSKMMFLFSLFDGEVRRAFGRFLRAAVRNPSQLFRPVYSQNIIVLQPVDVLPTGEMDLCDGCPNMTFWENRLIRSCMVESYYRYSCPIIALPKAEKEDKYI